MKEWYTYASVIEVTLMNTDVDNLIQTYIVDHYLIHNLMKIYWGIFPRSDQK